MKIDDTGRVIEFSEKPKGEALEHMRGRSDVLFWTGEEILDWYRGQRAG